MSRIFFSLFLSYLPNNEDGVDRSSTRMESILTPVTLTLSFILLSRTLKKPLSEIERRDMTRQFSLDLLSCECLTIILEKSLGSFQFSESGQHKSIFVVCKRCIIRCYSKCSFPKCKNRIKWKTFLSISVFLPQIAIRFGFPSRYQTKSGYSVKTT